MKKIILLSLTHIATLLTGFVLGVYLLPILTAPQSPPAAMLSSMASEARYTAEFKRGLKGNDFLHWGEGKVSITTTQIIHEGKLAPGPDYKLYLVPEFVEHESEFLPIKSFARYIGDVKSFGGFALDLPADLDPAQYNTILIWCEAFSEFITAAQYQ